MNKTEQIKESVMNFLSKLATERHLVALRDGMLASIPIILVGSTFLLLGSQKDVLTSYLPAIANSGFGKWYIENCSSILIPFRFTMGMLSLYVTFSIAASLAKQYEMPILPQGMGSVAVFLLTIQLAHLTVPETGKAAYFLPVAQMGGDGLFMAILTALFTVEISRGVMWLWDKLFAKKKDPEESKDQNIEIPAAVSEAFISFLPLLTVIFIIWLLVHNFNLDLYKVLIDGMKPLEKMGDTVWCVAVVNFFMHIFGFAGLHGISVINGVFFALWQKFLLMNTEAHMTCATAILPRITAYPFYQWFVWIGGAGVTLPVPFLLLTFKNKHMKRIGAISIIPSLFNVNEPLLFGLPVVANPILAIPFILSPIVCGITSFFAFQLHLVTRPFIEVPWVLPAFFGAPLCTQDLKALILLGLNMLISGAIWYPFLKSYEKQIK